MKKVRIKTLSIFLSVILAFSFKVQVLADSVKTDVLSKEDIKILDSIFDPDYYAENNPDVVEELGTDKTALFGHFCIFGVHELRQPSEDFNVAAYAAGYNDLSAAFGTDVLSYYKHYYEFGRKEGRAFTTPESLGVLGINGSVLLEQQKTVADESGRPQFSAFYEQDSKDFIIPYDDSDSEPEPEPEPAPAPEPVPVMYTVSFDVSYNDVDCPNIPDEQRVEIGGLVSRPTPDPAVTGKDFGGWYKDEECNDSWNFNEDRVTGDITLYAKWTDSGCLAAGTLITMANGERKAIEKLKGGDEVRVFDHETGEISTARLFDCYVYSENETTGFTLHFSNNIDITVVCGHCFFDKTENKYIALTYYNAADYIGHLFYNADGDCWETLESVERIEEPVDAYFIATENYYNVIANGMLSGEDAAYEIFLNIFDYGNDLMMDKEKKAADIDRYGLWSFDNCIFFSRQVYDVLNLKYLSVAIGKGMLTPDWIRELEEMSATFYPELTE